MKVLTIQTKNVKGKDLSEKLTGREIYVGPNGSGKSTRLNAMTILLQGFLSSLGKTNISNMDLASGDFLSISGSLDDGFSFARKFRKKKTKHGDGTVSYSCTADYTVFPDEGETKPKERLDRITKHVGSFSVMFDLGEFMKMSDAQKRAFIFDLSSPEAIGWNLEKILGLLEEDKQRTFVEELWIPDDSIADNLRAVLESLDKEIRDHAAVLKNKSKARDELVGPRQEAMEGEQGDVKEIETEIDDLRGKKAEHEKSIAQAKAAEKSRESLQAQIDAAQKRRLALEGEEFDLVGAQLGIDMRVNDIAIDKKTLKELRTAITEAEGVRDKAVAEMEASSKEIEETNDLVTRKREEASNIRDNMIPKLREVCSEIADVVGEKAVEVIFKHIEGNCAELDKEADEAEAKLPDLQDVHGEKVKANYVAMDALKEADRSHRDADDSIGRQERDLEAAKRDLQGLKAKAERRDEQVAQAKQHEADMNQALKDLPPAVSTEMAENLISSIDQQIADLQVRLKRAVETTQLMQQFDKIVAEVQDLEDVIEWKKSFRDALGAKGIQAQIMSEVMDPIQSRVNDLLGKVTDAEGKPYVSEFQLLDHNGKEVFNIHRVVGDNRIAYNALAGGEEILFGAALVIALILLKDPPVKALCIEAAELDRSNFFKLISALNVIAGGIDNIMVASCSDSVCDAIKEGEIDELKPWNAVQL